MTMIRRHFVLPPVVSGAELPDVWSVLVPAARTNEISNPSGETNTTGYTAGAGSLARSTAQQYHGAYSFAYTPSAATTDGFYYTFTSTIALRAVSCKFLGQKGVPYALAYASTAPAELVTYTFVATGRWQWIWLYADDSSATSRRIYFRKNGSASLATFYVDGVQSEVLSSAAERVSSYLDGDQVGLLPNQSPPAFYWNGTPHASTSVRSGLTRAGGEVRRFKDYGFTLLSIVGLGLAVPQNVGTEYARADGGYDDYTRKPTRQFSLVGRFSGRSYDELRDLRGDLGALVDRDLSALDQELVLLHHIEDALGTVVSSESRILAKYQDGLSGNTDNQYAETAPITFTQSLPIVTGDNESGSSLDTQDSVSASAIVKRSPSGVYSALGSGATATPLSLQDIHIAATGFVYVTGFSANIGGVAAADGIAYWDGSAWNAMSTGIALGGGGGYALASDASGRIYAGGSFANASGVANTGGLARWTGAAWESITPAGSQNGIVTSLAFDSAGNLYAGGSFTTINAVAASGIARMSTAGVWTAMSTGLNAGVNTIVIGPADTIYAGGSFTVAATRVAYWTGSAWAALGNGLDGIVRKLALAPNGLLYAAGDFNNSGSVSMVHAAVFNGVAWAPLGTGLTGGVSTEVIALPSGLIIYGGYFTAAGGITVPDSFAFWNGATWSYADADLPGTSNVNALAVSIAGDVYIGYETSGSVLSAGQTAITNSGSARSYPTIVVNGPSSGTSRIYSIQNLTTGRSILLNYTIQAGETATMVFQPDNLSFTSNVQGDIASKILPGSSEADFFLAPGANTIGFFSADSTVTAPIRWRAGYTSLDAAAQP